MKIIAGLHVHNSERWIGYCIASIYHAVDHILVGITRQSTDKSRMIIGVLQGLDPSKITIYDNDRTDLTEGGFGAVKTEMIQKCGELGADWILNPDADHIYYPMEGRLHKLAESCQGNAIKFRQYFLYSGLRTLPLDPNVNPKANNPGYSMFASFFKYSNKVICKGGVHETVKGLDSWQMQPDFDFVHIGPMAPDWEQIEKEYFYSGLRAEGAPKSERKPFNEWITNLQNIKTPSGRPNETFYPKSLLDFTARRRLEIKILVPLEKVKPEGLPPVMEYYYNGCHELDLEWLKKFITGGNKNG